MENLIESKLQGDGVHYLLIDEVQNVKGFEEYEHMKEFYHKEINSNLMIELNQYILEGGFPRTVQTGEMAAKKTYVGEVAREIFEIRNLTIRTFKLHIQLLLVKKQKNGNTVFWRPLEIITKNMLSLPIICYKNAME